MKSILFILILGVASVSADIATDFINDNILKPLVGGIYENTVGFLIGSLFNLIRPTGKRDLSNVGALVSQVSGLFQAYKDKLSAIVQTTAQKFQALIFNLFNPTIDYTQVLSEAAGQLKEASVALLNGLYEVFQSVFGQNFLDFESSASRSVFGNIANILNDFTQTIEQSLSSYAQTLAHAVSAGNFNVDAALAQLAQTVQDLVQHLTQAISQLAQVA
jgi:hypothetical protein